MCRGAVHESSADELVPDICHYDIMPTVDKVKQLLIELFEIMVGDLITRPVERANRILYTGEFVAGAPLPIHDGKVIAAVNSQRLALIRIWDEQATLSRPEPFVPFIIRAMDFRLNIARSEETDQTATRSRCLRLIVGRVMIDVYMILPEDLFHVL